MGISRALPYVLTLDASDLGWEELWLGEVSRRTGSLKAAVWLPGGQNSDHNQVNVQIQTIFIPACELLCVTRSHDSRDNDPMMGVWESFGPFFPLLLWVNALIGRAWGFEYVSVCN